LEYSLIENLQRKDVDDIDVAKALKKLYDFECSTVEHLSFREFARRIESKIGLKQTETWRYLSLLNLVPEVQEMVSEDKLGVKLASQLATVEKEKQEEVAKMLTKIPTEDRAEEFIRKVKRGEKPETALEEVQPTREIKVMIFFKNERVDFKLPSRYWKILSDVSERTKKTFSELITEALEKYLEGLGYGKGK
jgi:ParB family chromosome partitioning protein